MMDTPFEALLAELQQRGYRDAEMRARVAAMPVAPPVTDSTLLRHFTQTAMQAHTIGAAAASDGGPIIEAGREYEFASGGRVTVREIEA